MGHTAHLEDRRSVMDTAWTLLAISWTIVILRFIVRFYLRQKHLIVSDIWLAVAAINTLGYVIGGYVISVRGGFDGVETGSQPASDDITVQKVTFIVDFLFDIGVYFPKFSMLAFYYHIIHPTAPRLRMCLHFSVGFAVVAALVTVLLNTLWCGPNVETNWWDTRPGACQEVDSAILFRLVWVLNVSSDLIIFIIPFPLFASLLALPKKDKIGMVATFAIGFITIGVSIGRFVALNKRDDYRCMYIWGLGELSASLVAVSLPALRPLIRKTPSIFRRARDKQHRRSNGKAPLRNDKTQKETNLSTTMHSTIRIGILPDVDDSDLELRIGSRTLYIPNEAAKEQMEHLEVANLASKGNRQSRHDSSFTRLSYRDSVYRENLSMNESMRGSMRMSMYRDNARESRRPSSVIFPCEEPPMG